MRKNNRGFTLIELLAVIVILGLLMAIAIPSVTKYITQSRKKTLVNSMDSYITAVTTAVNDNEFGAMSNQDVIYYIPVSDDAAKSCVSLEKGGTDPFGNWKEAYVAVNYNADKYSYDYFFTFYDDAGYGMSLTKSDDIKPSGDGQIINPTPVNADSITSQLGGRAKEVKVLTVGSCNSSSVVAGGNVEEDTSENKITFQIYINGIDRTNTYTCDEGMTWEEFIDSQYNITDSYGYYLTPRCTENVGISNGSSFIYVYNDYGIDRVEDSEVITSNYTYMATMITSSGSTVGGGCND